MLFRYSALTFNGHRIHFDRDYATGVEHYPGLVVHAPLTATLLAGLLQKEALPGAIRSLRFRALQPLFENDTIELQAARTEAGADAWALAPRGGMAMLMEVRT